MNILYCRCLNYNKDKKTKLIFIIKINKKNKN